MIRLIVAVPVLVILILFTLSNREPVRLTLWPTDFLMDVPLSLAVLVGMAVAFVLGALFVWLSALAQRRRARRAEYMVRQLEEQVQSLRANLGAARAGAGPAAGALAGLPPPG